MAAPFLAIATLVACVVGIEHAKCAAPDGIVDIVLSLKNEITELRRNGEEHERISKGQQRDLETLKRTIETQESVHKSLKNEFEQFKKKTGEHESNIFKLDNEIAELKKKNIERENEVVELERERVDQHNEITTLRKALQEHQGNDHVRDRRSLQRVAFSAYLTHYQKHTGVGQKIMFDAVLLNEGFGYNPHLGAFVAPASGLYLFSFSVAKYMSGEARVRLVKNGVGINGAIVEVRADHHDHQASNVALVVLDVGDAVYIEEHYRDDAQIFGNPTFRWTTFTGVFLA